MSIEVMKMALEALEQLQGCTDSDDGTVEAITVWCPEVIDALRQAIEQAEHVHAVNMKQERVDETAKGEHMTDLASVGEVGVWGEREWVGLTYEEHDNIKDNYHNMTWTLEMFARAVEQALKEKNT